MKTLTLQNETRGSKPEIGNPKPNTQNRKPEIRNPRLENWDLRHEPETFAQAPHRSYTRDTGGRCNLRRRKSLSCGQKAMSTTASLMRWQMRRSQGAACFGATRPPPKGAWDTSLLTGGTQGNNHHYLLRYTL